MSQYLLVELADDLAAQRTTRRGVWASLMQVSGVVAVVDLSAISRATLDTFLLPEDQSADTLRPKRKGT